MQVKQKVACSLIIACLAIALSTSVAINTENHLHKKTAYEFMNRLIERGDDIDVLVVGSSQVSDDFLPMELWAEYGMTAYGLHANNNGPRRYKPMVELALQYCHPKLIVLSTDQYWEESAVEKQIASYHEYADAFPFSMTKIRTTFSLYENPIVRTEILFPFLMYHNRWKEASAADFDNPTNPANGGLYNPHVTKVVLPEPLDDIASTLPDENAKNIDVIKDFITTFQEKGIPVLVATFPFEMETGSKKLGYFRTLEDELAQMHIPYLNFAERCTEFDGTIDFEDPMHLNASGAKKLTLLLGSAIKTQYKLPDKREDEVICNQWNSDYEEYRAMKINAFADAGTLQSALLLAKDRDFTTTVYIDYSSSVWQDETCLALLKSIAPFARLQEARDTQCSFLGIVGPDGRPSIEELDPDDSIWTDALGGVDAISSDSADAYVAIFDKTAGKHLCTKAYTTERALVSSEKKK